VGRRLGQHFLTRKSILDKIAAAACPDRESLVVEIGPGRGALTESLLDRAEKVTAIEVDPILVHYLQHKFRDPIAEGRLDLVPGDILRTDLAAWGPCVIAGNLPYYITSPILERLFVVAGVWSRAVFLVQAEVAARIAAEPGSRDYGFLSVTTQLRADTERLFEVPREAFRPPPKVQSEVIKLVPREPPVRDLALLVRFLSVCFRQKRKTLRNNLAVVYGKERAQTLVDARVRAEQLSIPELVGLYERCHV
jgi:16S rRNA (adenine1518-N6/adenine1519-N6)-dimethyltransferase